VPLNLNQRQIETRISAQDEHIPLLDWLSTKFTYHTREQWRLLISNGHIRINGSVMSAGEHPLHAGDTVAYLPPHREEPSVATHYRILWEDEDLLVIDKPADLPCHPAGAYFQHTLWHMLQRTGYETVKFVHRLDRETSGIVVAAKNKGTARELSKQLEQHECHKEYLVVVEGIMAADTVAEGWLGPDHDSEIRKKKQFVWAPSPPEAKAWQPVSTTFRLIHHNNSQSLLNARLHTGRHHQIRATLCSLGFPVVGDKIYGVDERLFLRFIADGLTEADWANLRLPRQALHAHRLSFIHPGTSTRHTFESPFPADM
jgi:23S rRNA pseudouridine955/2504/2580 synthase/23S rRNA pseudouridine1911/1915/1917 synthase